MSVIDVATAADPRLDVYCRLTDAQMRNRLEPGRGVLVAESEKVVRVALASGLVPLSLLVERRQLEALAPLIELLEARGSGAEVRCDAGHLRTREISDGVPVYVLGHDQLCRLVGYNVTRGVLCAFRRPAERPAAELLAAMPDARRVAVLEDVTDSTNVGAAFRSAAALGVDAVLLTPGCCDPLVRRAVRVSMGTVFQVPWARFGAWPAAGPGAAAGLTSGAAPTPGPGACDGIALLRGRGFTTAALALRDDSCTLGDARLRAIERLAMVFGTEGDGLADETIASCDLTVRIPMSHGVDSLNVAASCAVAFWDLCQRPGPTPTIPTR